jgi:hypothetical protein
MLCSPSERRSWQSLEIEGYKLGIGRKRRRRQDDSDIQQEASHPAAGQRRRNYTRQVNGSTGSMHSLQNPKRPQNYPHGYPGNRCYNLDVSKGARMS